MGDSRETGARDSRGHGVQRARDNSGIPEHGDAIGKSTLDDTGRICARASKCAYGQWQRDRNRRGGTELIDENPVISRTIERNVLDGREARAIAHGEIKYIEGERGEGV